MKSYAYKLIEFVILFLIIPVSFVFAYPPQLKGAIGILGFVYICVVLLKVEGLVFKMSKHLNWGLFWRQVIALLAIIIVLTITYVWFTDASQLFIVPRTKPMLFVSIVLVYSLLSVYPQELIFRTFFFQRYHDIFKTKAVAIICNALVFMLAHLFFNNMLVLLLTFLGGLIFAYTYTKTQSTLLVSIEHAIYGCWLFTVGMGEMLGFPS